MHLIHGGFDDEVQRRQHIREMELRRILLNLEDMLTNEEKKQAEGILWWLNLRDINHQEPAHYRANPGEPVEAFEERIRIAQEMEDIFPEHRVGTCANIWLWLKLGAPGEN